MGGGGGVDIILRRRKSFFPIHKFPARSSLKNESVPFANPPEKSRIVSYTTTNSAQLDRSSEHSQITSAKYSNGVCIERLVAYEVSRCRDC